MSSLYLLKVQKPGVAKKARSAALLNGDDSVGFGQRRGAVRVRMRADAHAVFACVVL